MSRQAAIVAANEARSIPYAHSSPTRSISNPPIAGPTMSVVWKSTWFRASAEGSWAGPTRLGVIAERMDNENPPPPATSAAPT